jgi:hypothetical protein
MSVKSSVWRVPRQHATAPNLATGCYGWSLIISRPASSLLLLLTWPYFNLYIQIVFLSFYSNTTGVNYQGPPIATSCQIWSCCMLSWHSPSTGLDTHLRLVSFLVGVVYLIRLPQLYQCRISHINVFYS